MRRNRECRTSVHRPRIVLISLCALILGVAGCSVSPGASAIRQARPDKPPTAAAPSDRAEPRVIDLDEAYNRYHRGDARAVWIDLRDPAAYAAGHIAGAINIPLAKLADRMGEIPVDRSIVLYCTSETTSGLCTAGVSAGRILIQHGYRPAYVLVLETGLDAWRKAGYPMTSRK